MDINPFIFRAYDIRGVYGKDLTEEVLQKIGFILGKNKGKFLVGNDIRESGKNLASALIQGLQTAGADVVYSGTNSFGQCLFSGLASKVDKTLLITASHLPPEWNGLKIYFGDGEPFSQETLEKLRDEIIAIWEQKIEFKSPEIREVDFRKEYIEYLYGKFPTLRENSLKVIVDCGNGSVSLAAPDIFNRFSFKTIELFCDPDPNFPNRESDPKITATKILQEMVPKEGADFGVAFDGDGDRGIIIDDKGRYLTGNEIGIIIGKYLLENQNLKNRKIIKTVACSMAIDEELREMGAEIIEIPVGHTFVISACKKENAVMGIEESGHTVMPKYFLFDDAVLIPLEISKILVEKKKKLSEIVDELKIYPFEEIVFACSDEKKFSVIENLKQEFEKEYEKINTLDGVKVYFDCGWILIRASNTSQKIRLYVEAKDEQNFKLLKDKFSNILKEKCRQ
jgi:phosphomannomutase